MSIHERAGDTPDPREPSFPEYVPTSFEHQQLLLADIQQAQRVQLLAAAPGELSLAAKASLLATERNAYMLEHIDEFPEDMTPSPEELDYKPWLIEPSQGLPRVTMQMQGGTAADGSVVAIPVVRFSGFSEYDKDLDPFSSMREEGVEQEMFSIFEEVPMAEVQPDGSLRPLGDFTESDIETGLAMLAMTYHAAHDFDLMPDISDDLAWIIHPKIRAAIGRSGILGGLPQDTPDGGQG